MKKEIAQEKGYIFTGAYSSFKDEILAKKAELKKQGYKSVIVESRYSGYERMAGARKGAIAGYSLYAERKYSIDQEIKTREKEIERHEERVAQLKEQYEKDLKELIEEKNKNTERLEELKLKRSELK